MARRWWLLGVIATGCGEDAPGPSSEDFALAADGLASIDSEAAVVAAIELSLSGDFVVMPMSLDEEHPTTLARIAKNSVAFATGRVSAGCLTTPEPVSDTVMHQLVDCTIDGHTASGNVVSVFSLIDGVHVEHASDDLQVDGRAIRLRSTVEGFLAGSIQTRRRTLQMTIDGDQVVAGSWVATLDTATGCGGKAGTGTASFEGSLLRRTDSGLAWCGDGITDTLTGGRVELARGTAAVNLEFLGDDQVVLDGDNYTVDSTLSELRD